MRSAKRLKIAGGWQVIVASPLSLFLFLFLFLSSASVVSGEDKPSRGKVLVIVSSARALKLKGEIKHPTGFFLNELGVPVKALVDAGYQPVFADPLGNTAVMDALSDKPSYFGGDQAENEKIKSFVQRLPGLKRPHVLADIAHGDLSQYAGIFVPGGHAPMEDLWWQPELGKIFKYFHAHHKPTALICHGPIALLSSYDGAREMVSVLERGKAAHAHGHWPYKGYAMTVFSTAEEKPAEDHALGGSMKFYPEEALRAAGAEVSVGPAKKSHVVIDRELITGQNPYSDAELAADFIKALAAEK